MNQEDLLDAVEQAAQQDDLGVRLLRAQRLPPPLQAPRREALLQHLAQRLHHAVEFHPDGFANRLAKDGEEQVGEHARIFAHGNADGFFDGGLQRFPQLPVAGAQTDRLRQHGGNILRTGLRTLQPLAQFGKLAAFRPQQDRAEFLELFVGRAVMVG